MTTTILIQTKRAPMHNFRYAWQYYPPKQEFVLQKVFYSEHNKWDRTIFNELLRTEVMRSTDGEAISNYCKVLNTFNNSE